MSLFLIVINLKMITKDLLGLSDLLRAQILYIYESIEVFLVRKDEDLIFGAFQIVAPSLEDFNNSQKFLIVSFVISFYYNHLPRKEGYGIPLTNLANFANFAKLRKI